MKLPISWLKEYIDVNFSSEKLAEMLTMSGTAVERIDKKGNDAVLELEITTNRPDCLSILGVSKEVSALTGKKVRSPKLKSVVLPRKLSKKDDFPGIQIEAKKACTLYTARLIRNVGIKPAPLSVQSKLGLLDLRPINNVVDATNFVLYEMGHPLHAFDHDKVKGGRVIVRFSRNGEKFIGINGVEYVLDDKTLVIADAEKPIAIAGVIGGKHSEVGPSTKNILLESALFDQALVRQASKRYKISTDSSYRFERSVDPEGVLLGSARAADLIKEWGGGQEIGFWYEGKGWKIPQIKINLRPSRLKRLLGMSVPEKKILNIFKNLGLQAKASTKDKILVSSSSARRDLAQEVDLIEEILRIEGFDKVPTAIPITRHAGGSIEDRKALHSLELKQHLAGLGFNEIISYSLLSEKALKESGWNDWETVHKITNPLSAEQEYFRPWLVTGMLQAVLFNVHRKAESLKFFEIGNRYASGKEETVLALGLYGYLGYSWKKKDTSSFYDLKGVIENLMGYFKIKSWQCAEDTNDLCENAASILVNGKKAGFFGKLNQTLQKKWDLPKELYFAEIVLGEIVNGPVTAPGFKVKAIAKFPAVRRDIAFILDEKISVKALQDVMQKAGSPFLHEALLFDEYIGKNIPAGRRSLAFSLAYRKETGTFTEEEINVIQTRVGETLKNQFQVEFR